MLRRDSLLLWLLILPVGLIFPLRVQAQQPPREHDGLSRIESEINQAIERHELPGAVVLIVHKDEAIYYRALGSRCLEPKQEKMTADSIFDLASLTKPAATATSIFILRERGKLTLEDPVAKYWPAFGQNGKEKVTIEQCLLHVSGLINDNPVADYDDGKGRSLERIAALKLEAEPGSRFRYSDVGFMVLGQVVERVSGQSLDRFSHQNIFEPLGMKDTSFWKVGAKIPAETVARIAPTTKENDSWLTGQVHDPRARRLGGVAGHAGLFSTADDLAIFCRMILNGGEYNGRRILQKESVAKMTEACPIPGGQRSRGWDVDTSYSKNRGELFPKGKSFGHTGFTGTSLWLDPATQTAVIFLSNRVHPNEKGNVTKLRATVATQAAQAVGYGSK
ncbi:MAG TPA: serine hydrolase domain-containing protein [Gemmataceae bacterium]|jgi:CubicO group peptidase (beta-lactamase class C family)|nr:serine hydrolase domain-containing protein [Gemmataceae bacterium]